MANVESESPAAGHAQVKTGNRVLDTAGGHALVLGNSLAGYAETVSGRPVVFMIAVATSPSAQQKRSTPSSPTRLAWWRPSNRTAERVPLQPASSGTAGA